MGAIGGIEDTMEPSDTFEGSELDSVGCHMVVSGRMKVEAPPGP